MTLKGETPLVNSLTNQSLYVSLFFHLKMKFEAVSLRVIDTLEGVFLEGGVGLGESTHLSDPSQYSTYRTTQKISLRARPIL